MIAMAVAHDPRLLIADEPTTALDAIVRREILRLIDRLRADKGLAVILVSHDLGLVAAHADRMLVLRRGGLVGAGAPARRSEGRAVGKEGVGQCRARWAP